MDFKNKEPRSWLQDKVAGTTNLEDRDQQPAFSPRDPHFPIEEEMQNRQNLSNRIQAKPFLLKIKRYL